MPPADQQQCLQHQTYRQLLSATLTPLCNLSTAQRLRHNPERTLDRQPCVLVTAAILLAEQQWKGASLDLKHTADATAAQRMLELDAQHAVCQRGR